MHIHDRWTILQYFCALLGSKRFDVPPDDDADILNWIKSYGRSLRLPRLEERIDYQYEKLIETRRVRREEWRVWRAAVLAKAREPEPAPSPLQNRVYFFVKCCGLTSSQGYLLALLARASRIVMCSELLSAANGSWRYRTSRQTFDLKELCVVFRPGIEMRDLRKDGALLRFGLIEMDSNDNLSLTDTVEQIISMRRLSAREVRDQLLGLARHATLDWDDFAHIGASRDLAARIVENNEAQGANILLYGPPGTGKSEFAKTLGARVKRGVHFIGEADKQSSEPNRRERVAALMIATELGAAAGKMIVVVDEADDLFAGVDEDDASTRHGSKVFMNRLVEQTRVPTIWITNNLSRLGPAVVRRMNLVVRFPRPGVAVRQRIVERVASRTSIDLDVKAIGQLARLPAAPALIESAILSAARMCGSGEEALQILGGGLKAMGFSEIASPPAPIDFDPSLSRADVDLRALAARIKSAPSKALSFCLSGPPGTGKSAYARYLAAELGYEVLEKRYSDLASSYLGESEKAIASAFEEAADLGAFLILDEADSLLRDRGAARHSWEITQVNEMLTWMERHPLPFACTTNAPEMLDPATARRFLFKVRFLPMDAGQIAAAFLKAFGIEAPKSMLKLELLTPGDFAVVTRKAEILDERGPARLAQWLEEEVAAKPEGKKMRMGF
jgi:SpoVK/Ycf46/Vps4 family AAA+-type ATPase